MEAELVVHGSRSMWRNFVFFQLDSETIVINVKVINLDSWILQLA